MCNANVKAMARTMDQNSEGHMTEHTGTSRMASPYTAWKGEKPQQSNGVKWRLTRQHVADHLNQV